MKSASKNCLKVHLLLLSFCIVQAGCQQSGVTAKSNQVIQCTTGNRVHKYSVDDLEGMANAGDAKAAYILSNYYSLDGRNYERSVMWRKKAADMGDPVAQFSYGNLAYSAAKSQNKRNESIRYVELSAQQGFEPAKNFLKYTKAGGPVKYMEEWNRKKGSAVSD